jgi:murein DD-endopeptidase MepM/ murein hydrolase activator NlpD
MRSRLYSLWPAVVAVIAACALGILGLPAAASAAVPGISVQRVWTDKASYAPGETIRFNAEIDNSLGGTVLAQGHCSANSFPVCLSISTSPSFFTNGRSADFPPGASTWSWNTTAPSSQGQYTFKVTAFDGFNGNFSERTADSFTIGSSVTVSRTYVANEKWAEANQFSPGDLVRYQIVVSATAKVTINARMLVTGPQSRTILDTGGDIEVSPSAGSVYFQSTIPSDAPLGTYTEKATVTSSGQSTVRTSTFSVTQATATITPFRCPAAPMSFPVADGGYIGWIYQDSASINTDPSGIHSGLDFWAGNGTAVVAIGTGTVTRLNGTSGVDVYYPSIGLEAYTGELKDIQVGVGSSVSAGTVIGYESGNHFHFSFTVLNGNDQSKDWNPNTTPHRDPTPYLAPNGNFDSQRGAQEHWSSWTYTQWCG